jgi:RNA polymerase sigma-70 factor, ECF subfamily
MGEVSSVRRIARRLPVARNKRRGPRYNETRKPALTDEAVIARVREGERELFEVLVERYKRGIANFIGAGVRDAAEVADLSQETFLRAYAHLGTFNPRLGKFSTWIYQIARNVVRTHLGRSLRRPVTAALGEEQTLENAVADVAPESDPAGGVLRAEAERELRAALAELPERTRTVLALRYFDNLEYHAIASTLGLSLGNVKTLIHRGKIALAKKMREHSQRPPSTRGGHRGLLLV